MGLLIHIIQECLIGFVIKTNSSFDKIFDLIGNEKKEEYKSLLKYINRILDSSISNIELKPLHIHIEERLENNIKILISEFIIIKKFIINQQLDFSDQEINNIFLEGEIKSLKTDVSSPLQLSCHTKGWDEKRIRKERKRKRIRLKFLKTLSIKSTFNPKFLFNCQFQLYNPLVDLFSEKSYGTNIDELPLKNSYGILNPDKTLNELDNKNLIDNLESVILFDSERKQKMLNYSFEEINKWNEEYETNFKNYIIITHGREPMSFQRIRSKIDTIKEKFKIPQQTSYTILSSEIDLLFDRCSKTQIPVEFIGFSNSTFWESFLLEISIRELYELRSIKMMNIYSLCLNEDIKNHIIEELFSKAESSKLITNSTKQALLELREEDLNVIKDALTSTLDLIIDSELKTKVIEVIHKETSIILDHSVINNKTLRSKISTALSLTKSNKLVSWTDIKNINPLSTLILAYRDQGKFPNYYYPNIIESEFSAETNISAILLNFFFSRHYNWSKYNLLKDLHKYLNHTIRQTFFEWNKLKTTIQSFRPESKLNIDWNLEYEFSNSENRETFKLKLKGQSAKTCNGSDLYIYRISTEDKPRIEKINWIYDHIDFIENKFLVQKLDDILDEFNPFEKMISAHQQEEELDIIRKQFNLGDESVGRLWKILLKRIADSKGDKILYDQLKIYFESKGLKIVSFFHFKNSWINPQSESIAPLSKRIFIGLCEYLKIPRIYFVIIQRLKNASRQSSRQSTRQMNCLLSDLFNDGCFDAGINIREIISNKLSYYINNHPLDELGIDESYLLENLITLTELIQPELKLLELESIEKLDQ